MRILTLNTVQDILSFRTFSHNINLHSTICNIFQLYFEHLIGKGKALRMQTWTGPEGSRRFRLADFMTFGT